ncbi:MAG TPA: hypothetical protein VGV12_00330 [Gemmatimonadales bacterium]|nr:hypothetical protein [Gemmatimonadales bacterium]
MPASRAASLAAELQATERDIGEGLTAALSDVRQDVTYRVGKNES